jgi:hypothetical protein
MKEIVVITNGFVYMGDVSERESESGNKYIHINDASCIRSWGTTSGLGEIALRGPTKKTVLDPAGIVEVAWHAVIMRVRCQYD